MLGLKKFAFILFAAISLQAADIESIEGPPHEAYLLPVTDVTTKQTIKTQPPIAIQETIPTQTDPRTTWIPGYWSWDSHRNDFIWVGGMWRKAPPSQEWIKGYWQQFEEGWVWISGFWNSKPEGSLEYISAMPPNTLEESVNSSPGIGYFWAPGFWQFNSTSQQFTWLNGRWERLDPNWILVPAHYVWRPNGYVFVDAYWDWVLKERGTAYASVFIPASMRANYKYEPTVIVDPQMVVRYTFFTYPNYLYFFCHHHYYNPDFWVKFHISPPWWDWNTWWSITWTDQWALWWWWTHPGFATPVWINAALAAKIAPPSNDLIQLMAEVKPPANVLSKGVVSETSLRPTGRITPSLAVVEKPEIPTARLDKKAEVAKLPNKPTFPGDTSTFRSRPTSDSSNIKPAITQPVFPAQRPRLDFKEPNIQRDTFKSTPVVIPTQQRQQYTPPQTVKQENPFGGTKRVYQPKQPQYTPSAPDYRPSAIQPTMPTSSFSEEMYTPPSSSNYQPKESIRTRSTQPVNYFTPTLEVETDQQMQPESEKPKEDTHK